MVLTKYYKFLFENSPYDFEPIEQRSNYVVHKKDSIEDFVSNEDNSLTIFVHGWMESLESAKTKTDYVTRGLKNHNYSGKIAGYIWESDKPWKYSKKKAQEVGEKISSQIDEVKNKNSKISINLVAHSLGCLVSLEASQRIKSKIDNLVLMAGAIRRRGFPTEIKNVNSVYNFYDRSDELLLFAYPVYELSFPIGSSKINREKVENIQFDNPHHSYYYLDPRTYKEIVNIIQVS
jgi:pimeloyl-ACP methyl ester carboxylesterase